MEEFEEYTSCYSPRTGRNLKKGFSKLTLTKKQCVHQKPSKPTTVEMDENSRDMNDSRITEDEDDDFDDAVDKINDNINTNQLQNQIFISGDITTTTKSTKAQQLPNNDNSETIGTLHYSDSDETNCSLADINPIVPLCPSQNKSQRKDSTPLFSQYSEDAVRISLNKCRVMKSTDDTVVSCLSSQLDRLGLDEFAELTNIPDDDKIRNSLLVKNHNERLKKMEIAEADTVLTISSSDEDENDNEEDSVSSNEEDEENDRDDEPEVVIVISDSDDDASDEDSNVNYDQVSAIETHSNDDSMSLTTRQKIENFFDNIPPLDESVHNLKYIKDQVLQKNELPVQKIAVSPPPQESIHQTDNSAVDSALSVSVKDSIADREEEIIPETPEESLCDSLANISHEISTSNHKSDMLPSQNDIIPSATSINENLETSLPKSFEETTVNISTKIKINILVKETSDVSTSTADTSGTTNESNKSHISNSEQDENNSIPKNVDNEFVEENEDDGAMEGMNSDDGAMEGMTTPTRPGKFDELNKTNFEIDEDMEKILNEMYGIEWQTPQLLLKCSTRKPKRSTPVVNLVEKQLQHPSDDAADFSLFHKNIACDLESTRLEKPTIVQNQSPAGRRKQLPGKFVPSPRANDFRPIQSPRNAPSKTPKHDVKKQLSFRSRRQTPNVVYTPKLSKLIDSDSEASSSTDDDDFDEDPLFSSTSSDDSNLSNPCSDDDDSPIRRIGASNKKDRKDTKGRRRSKCLFGMESVLIYDGNPDDDCNVAKENTPPRRLEKILEENSFTPKPSLPTVATIVPRKTRKLYTPQTFTDLEDFDSKQPERNVPIVKKVIDLPDLNKLIFNRKLEEVKGKFKTPKSVKSSKTKTETSVDDCKRNRCYSFLQSLGRHISEEFCHPDALPYRKNFQKNKVELAEKLFAIYEEKVFHFGAGCQIPITWNKKLLNTAGRCMTSKRFHVRRARVELSDKVLTDSERLRDTMLHELCHAATWIYNEMNGHGKDWRQWANKCESIFPELPKIDVCHAYDIEYKYTYKCVQCSAKSQAHSKSKKVENIRCRLCHGRIEIFLNKRSKDGTVEHKPVKEASGFAKYVKDNYKSVKDKHFGVKHPDLMKILGTNFKEMKVND